MRKMMMMMMMCSGLACSDEASLPEPYEMADLHEGGRAYDNVFGHSPPSASLADHPLWSTRPDSDSNPASGAETWRCKECHGWDYAGVEGAYGQGEHRTGFPGILETDKEPHAAFELLARPPDEVEAGHDYALVLTDREIWDLVRFTLEGAVDTRDIITDGAQFEGDVVRGQAAFEQGFGGELACASCHGADGLVIPHEDDHDEGNDGHDESVGQVARENPWEFHHKARFGHPGTAMHGYQRGGAEHEDIADLGAYAQTLPAPP